MKRSTIFLIVSLLLIPSVLIPYRIFFLKYPPFPAGQQKVWQVSMEAHVKAEGDDVITKIGLPSSRTGQLVVEEQIISGYLDFNLLTKDFNRVGIWSGMTDKGGEIIGYKSTLLILPFFSSKLKPPKLEPYPANVEKPEQELAKRIVSEWLKLAPPARLRAIASIAAGRWGEQFKNDNDGRKWLEFQDKHGQIASFLLLFRAAGLPARYVKGIWLEEGVTTDITTSIEVWTGDKWEVMLPSNGRIYPSASYLPLSAGEADVIHISSGGISDLHWTLSKKIISQWHYYLERIQLSEHMLDRWSLFHLPPEFQETFRILILVPMGALLICILRNLAGLPTFGVFMPVLMALAFRNTGLIYGLGIFAGLVIIGYAARRSLDRFRLLLVPRLSMILTMVIICFIVFALIGNKLGLRNLMAIGLLPFVILTMVIERFFVIMEESGITEGFKTAAGSALVSVIAYEILNMEPLQLFFFVYPELLFIVAAIQILLGRYTGYRLSEFIRFRKFMDFT